ncbi:MAG: apolipoprotein N-acyltransferase [Actinobacteria bacterium]|uniref:Unannotated protein n=1 Tax=freshwater metagenome TaxID=449393 RepID=A0A6J7I9Y8_9ZZZZ|nr:apolipoprotein N-acyltransferase [Actinomycetota bacterium]
MTRPSRTAVRRAGAAVTAGAGLLLALPPYDVWWLAPPALAVLLLAVRGTGLRAAYALAVLTHLVLFLPLLEWTRYVGTAPWAALAVLEALLAGLLGPAVVLAGRWGRPGVCGAALRGATVVGAVVAVEAVRARVPFGGLTWGRLSFSQSDGPLLAWASLGGAPGLSAVVAVVAVGLVALVGRPTRPTRAMKRRLAVALPLVVLPVVAGVLLPLPVDGPAVQVAAVQGNVPGQGLDAFAEDLVVLDNHLAQTRRLAADVAAGRTPAPDLVLWPENASDQDPRSEPAAAQRVDAAVDALGGVPLLLGAVLRDGGGRTSNGILVWGPDGVIGEPYRKRHLVPFGEYLPLRGLVTAIYPGAADLLPRDFSPGDRVGRLDLRGVPLAVGTCYEVAFDAPSRQAVRAGGQLLVLPSNNASYGRSGQSAQQLAMARLRAVEHGRSTVVVTTSGISALVRPDGRVVAQSGLYEPAVLTAALPRRADLTVATRWGPYVEAALVLLLPVGLALTRVRRAPQPRPTAPS